MNKVILIGRLTRDAEIKTAEANNTKIARFSLAVDRRFAKEGEATADFINCIAFNKTAEFIEKYVKKGTKLVVEGRIQTGSYTNKDGNKVYTTDVVVDNCEFAESKNSSSNASSTSNNTSNNDGFMGVADGVEDEGLPF